MAEQTGAFHVYHRRGVGGRANSRRRAEVIEVGKGKAPTAWRFL